MRISRDEAARRAGEAVDIIEAGHYRSPGGRRVEVRDLVLAARAGTVSYPPGHDCPAPSSRDGHTQVQVVNTTTLGAARDLVRKRTRPAALNFASAITPGGGFLHGARAQEESLCWSSGLFACLLDNDMYEFHQKRSDCLYTDYVIYSPDVPVFRGEDGELLEETWSCSFLTSPAPFAQLHLVEHPEDVSVFESLFETRIATVLSVAARHGHEALVLGAWGCGAFGNDSKTVARVFRDALAGPFRGVFSDVVFAIMDRSEDRRFLGPFRDAFRAV